MATAALVDTFIWRMYDLCWSVSTRLMLMLRLLYWEPWFAMLLVLLNFFITFLCYTREVRKTAVSAALFFTHVILTANTQKSCRHLCVILYEIIILQVNMRYGVDGVRGTLLLRLCDNTALLVLHSHSPHLLFLKIFSYISVGAVGASVLLKSIPNRLCVQRSVRHHWKSSEPQRAFCL